MVQARCGGVNAVSTPYGVNAAEEAAEEARSSARAVRALCRPRRSGCSRMGSTPIPGRGAEADIAAPDNDRLASPLRCVDVTQEPTCAG